ncbi:ATP-dependent DNA helicase RecG [Bdellovibrionales bacterium]|nr:ATP-dependent DNA helicase RecG [Bdellovibrionales bacterium]
MGSPNEDTKNGYVETLMALSVNTEVQYLKGVGPKLGDALRKRGIETVGDLLEWYPRGYEDRRAVRSISSLEPDQLVSIQARVLNVRSISMGRSHRKMYEVVIGDGTGRISCKYFRMPYKGYFECFQVQSMVRVSGKVTLYRGALQFSHPDIHPVAPDQDDEDAILPLYVETDGLRPGKLRKILSQVINELIDNPQEPKEANKKSRSFKEKPKDVRWVRDPYASAPKGVPECFPKWILDKYNLIDRSLALKEIHQPPTERGDQYIQFCSRAQRRIIFEEFFWLELHLAALKAGVRRERAHAMLGEMTVVKKLRESLPFELTGAQDRALSEVLSDLKKPYPMHRLVQGDVGCGKTMVALISAAYTYQSGFQSAIMVPTEILAEQHFKTASKLLEPLGIRVSLLTGQLKVSEKRERLESIKNGETHFVVGTHALIQEEVHFKKLGFVIIDEQHRFGVDQRNRLKAKGVSPHFLVMTATPIPRTLAMTVYGDLDLSIIDEMPPGRSPVITRKTFDNKRSKVYGFMSDQIAKGRQAYIVYPLVEESEVMDLKDAVSEFEKLKAQFPDLTFALLHGKMKSEEKEKIMREFRAEKYNVLISTTVIEVGVDVPNANIMIIEHAERFGLSQLHQLRGRVGRGEHKSYCVLMLSYNLSEEGRYRAEVVEQTNDGFKIAEADLELRGPGEFLGRRQSGLTGFKMANLIRDIEILKAARTAAFELIENDRELTDLNHSALRDRFLQTQEHYLG